MKPKISKHAQEQAKNNQYAQMGTVKVISPTKQHTPTPWHLKTSFKNELPHYSLEGSLNRTIASDILGKENVEFIVRAVNSHEALLKAAKQALAELERYKEGTDERYALRSAIAQAEGGLK